MSKTKNENAKVVKTFGEDFYSYGGALTLDPEYLGASEHGWSIEGEIHEDYYTWVNEFEAKHPTLGRVWGDFEGQVFADSEEAFKDFYENHPPDAWDYRDI